MINEISKCVRVELYAKISNERYKPNFLRVYFNYMILLKYLITRAKDPFFVSFVALKLGIFQSLQY